MRRIVEHPYAVVPAIAALILLLPFFLSSFQLRIAALVFIFSLAVLGLNLLMGFAGQVSLGHAGFFGIGAYAVAVGPTHLGIPSWAALLMGATAAGSLAYLVGRPILKLKGHYLAIATLGLGLLIAMVFTNEAKWTGHQENLTFASHGRAHFGAGPRTPNESCGGISGASRWKAHTSADRRQLAATLLTSPATKRNSSSSLMGGNMVSAISVSPTRAGRNF